MARYGTHKRSGRYNDWGKFNKGMSYALIDAGKQLTIRGTAYMWALADEFLREVDAKWPHHSSGIGKGMSNIKNGSQFGGDAMHPWYSGQLHDSIAIRIADKNRTVAISYMPSHAPTFPNGEPGRFLESDGSQSMPGFRGIVGTEMAAQAAQNAQYYFLPGTQLQLLIGVPYAEKVNETGRHYGYADALMDDLIKKVDEFMWSGSLWKRGMIRARTK